MNENFYVVQDVNLIGYTLPNIKEKIQILNEKLGKEFTIELQKLIYKNGISARNMARRLAPKKTGALRASIYVTAPSKKGSTISTRAFSGYFRAISAAARRKSTLEIDRNATSVEMQRNKNTKLKIGSFMNRDDNEVSAWMTEDSGDVESSFSAFPLESYKKGSSMFVIIGAAVYYAAFIEHGTYKMKPRPFIQPAAEWAQRKNIEDIKTLIQRLAASSGQKNVRTN